MADLLLSPIADRIIGSLCSVAVQQIATFWGVCNDLEELQDTISLIQGVLSDAEKKQVQNNGVRIWLWSLGDAVHDADDLVDDFETEALRRRLMDGNKVAEQVRTFFSASNQLAFRYRMGRRIRDIKRKLDKASKDKVFLLLEVRSPCEQSDMVARNRETHSYVPREEVIGRDEERDAIVKLLLECRFDESVPVIPIVGMGGLGKTMLAQSVFNDERIQKHFEPKIWVCVSDVFDLKVILRTIIGSEKVELDQLQKDLREKLSEKQYLLVLDDLWEEKREKWLVLKNLLVGGAEGSRVVVTTRSKVVASVTSTLNPYELGVLDEERSWSLFEMMAFRKEERKPSLVAIGKEIVKRCRGIPLAIKVIGTILYCKQSEFQWSSFNIEFSKLPQEKEDTILPTLRLSYDHLTSQLKHCFAYCRLFPKDYRIEVEMLIQLWMAQGFLKLSDPCDDQCLDDVGYQCFLDLFERSFFQEVKIDAYGVVKSCKMHDLIHDLAIEVAGEEIAHENWSSKEAINKNVRHLSLMSDSVSPSQVLTSFGQTRKIRTIVSLGLLMLDYKPEPIWDATLSSLDFTRTLDLKCLQSTIIPKSISRLKHLRYLDLSGNYMIKILPNCISNLYNLQTLKLNYCHELKELPRDMKRLVNLMHLEIDGCFGLRCMPVGIGQLTKLSTLSRYVLPNCDDSSKVHGGELRELASLNDLRGKLEISNLRHKETDFMAVILKEKKHLHFLSLKWDPAEASIGYEMLAESLQPHQNLQSLSLSNENGAEFPCWVQSLTNLNELELSSCKNYKHLFPLSQLHNLRKLRLSCLPSLEYISDICCTNINLPAHSPLISMPSLQILHFYELPNLKGWWRDNQQGPLPYFPRLTELTVQKCLNLIRMPLYPHLEVASFKRTSLEPFQKTLLEGTSISLSNLRRLWISYPIGDINTECLPEWFTSFSSLRYLSIKKWDQLKDLCPGILYLTSLRELEITSCNSLDLDGIEETTWRSLNGRLESLTLDGFLKIETLPEGIRHVTSLQTLKLYNCPDLMTIPEWIGDLASLRSLEIWHCPVLFKRCQPEIGEDWPKIAHIPDVEVEEENDEVSEGIEAPKHKWKLLKNCLPR